MENYIIGFVAAMLALSILFLIKEKQDNDRNNNSYQS